MVIFLLVLNHIKKKNTIKETRRKYREKSAKYSILDKVKTFLTKRVVTTDLEDLENKILQLNQMKFMT